MVQRTRSDLVSAIEAFGVVAVIRLREPQKLRAVIDALAAGGVRALEVTMTVPGAIDLIGELAPALSGDFLIGAGTVLDSDTARRAIAAGAQFIVSPVFRREILAACHAQDVAAIPGCFSPTEILDAWDAGADIVKVFPATALGPAFFKDLHGPLPQVKLMPTGGVTLENAGEWIKAGAVAVGAAWFHATGITPALGAKAAACTLEAVEAAKRAGAKISVDLNYRRKLWSEPQAQETMRPLVRQVDVVVANEEDLQAALGLHVPGADVTTGQLNLDGYRQVAEQVSREFGPPIVAITLRESVSASDNGWSGALWDATTGSFYHSQRYDVRIVDRIGAGDSFSAGLIFGLVTGRTPQAALQFPVAASALKQTIPGDFNRVSVEEVDRLAKGDTSGRVRR